MDNKIKEFLIFLAFFGFCQTPVSAIGSKDTLSVNLQNIDIIADKIDTRIRTNTNGDIVLSNSLFETMPKVLGNADPIRIIQFLPGVRTNSETGSGISIQGAEPQHTGILTDHVPVHGVSHLLGIFSLFNPLHYSDFSLKYNIFNAESTNYLGGELNVETDNGTYQERTISADAEIGLISTQASLRIKAGDKTRIILSGRRSYLNLLYGNLLSEPHYSLEYNFGDYNLTLVSKLSDRDFLRVSTYYGKDCSQLDYSNYGDDLSQIWKNILGQIFYRHKFNRFLLTNNLYYTTYNLNGQSSSTDTHYSVMSQIKELGYNLDFDFRNLTGGIRIQHFINQPQKILSDFDNLYTTPESVSTYYSAYAAYKCIFNEYWDINAGLKGGMLVCRELYFNLDPFVTLSYANKPIGKFELGLGRQTQPLSRVGMTATSMNCDFYLSPEEIGMGPQNAVGINLLYTKNLFDGNLDLEVRGYYRKLYNQVEYRGNLFELPDKQNLDYYLLKGHGYSYGGSVMLQKNKGKLTGWISYSYTHTRRTFQNNGYDEYYPAAGERPHEFNVMTNYTFNRHWNASACFVLASGEPYTPIRQFYLINGRAVPEFSQHNSARMENYMRLDVAANYNFNARGNYRHGISFSIYNATGHSNPMFFNYSVKPDKESVIRVRYNYIYFKKIIPSISYFLKF